ncbi:MAG: hypothetical protein U0457_07750 [Candidatus Sericytochromatia bacterium]
MGFLDNKKIPDTDKRFLFRHDTLSSIKYSISNFIEGNKCYYPNIFYIEGADGTGKTWFLNQLPLYSKTLKKDHVLVNLDVKDIVYSEVTGIINFLKTLRNALVEVNSEFESNFEKFDNSLKNFFAGTLVDDGTYHEIKIESKEETEPVKISFNTEEEEVKPKVQKINPASLKSPSTPANKPLVSKSTAVTSIQPKVNPLAKNESSFAPRKGTGPLNSSALSAYGSLNTYSEKEVPKKKSGQADVKAIAKTINNVVDNMKKTVVKTVDFKSILFRKFLEGFEQITSKHKIILTIDEFEIIQELQNFFFNIFLKNLKHEIIVVIAGQADMERVLKEKFDTSLQYIYISNFGYLHLEEYFKKFHVLSDPSVVDAVFELTSGTPLALSLVGSAFLNFKGDVFKVMKYLSLDEVDEKTLRYINAITLDAIPQNERRVVVLLSLIRNIDYDLIEHISGVFNAKNLLQTISEKYAFIDPKKGMHDTLKKFTRTYAKHEMTNLYDEIYRLSLEHFRNKIEENPVDKETITDYIYYQIRVNEDIGYTLLLSYISEFIATDISFCEILINDISGTGLSKELRAKFDKLRDCFPYVILKDHKRTLPLLEAIAEMQNRNPSMNILDSF